MKRDTKELSAKKNKKKATFLRVITVVFTVIVVILSAIGVKIYKVYNTTSKVAINKDNISLEISDDIAKLGKEKGKKNILFIGSDEGAGDVNGRSDSMILITIDKDNKKIKATSFMRDTLVTIPDKGKHNLNNAYAYGGPDLLVKTFNYNFGLDIKDYVKVDFSTFIKVIDKIGGVEINVNQNEIKVANDYIRNLNNCTKKSSPEIKKAGVQTLDGIQALGYSRNRYVGTDYARTRRQRKVLGAIVKKVSNLGYVDAIRLANDILPEVTTTLNIAEVSDIGAWSIINKIDTLEGDYFPKSYKTRHVVSDEYHILANMESLKKEIQDYIYNDIK